MINCKMCKKLFEPRNKLQQYCGTRNDKSTCAYKNRSPAKKRREPKPDVLIPDYRNETVKLVVA